MQLCQQVPSTPRLPLLPLGFTSEDEARHKLQQGKAAAILTGMALTCLHTNKKTIT
jgi:hypothetical protein